MPQVLSVVERFYRTSVCPGVGRVPSLILGCKEEDLQKKE